MTDLATTELTADEARELTSEIRRDLDGLLPKIRRAFEGRADKALGYDSWSAYCIAELNDVRVPVGSRPTAVAELRSAGMSTRNIGAALGVSQPTVVSDLRTAGDQDLSPAVVVGEDGRRYSPTRPAAQPEQVADAAGSVPAPTAQAAVAAALDAHVPDPGAAERAWRSAFYAAIKAPSELLLRLKAEEIAQHADDQDMQTLRLLVAGYADMWRRVADARGGNVHQLRRVQ